ncbi:SPOR domain-containing protein [Candidatus Nitrospira nitrificans]|uniref:Probable endolytic peptidoglycan transglycosylase RlpA n=1 Tax=Candidatus Nitrospira nitrificans TaxID=1742973 RepID=A0A0S4LAW6_9BACT|nr:SPOR domain-containing protein [Candidatus Nitrospira nitrificans]CUS34839.1 putative lipoprotein, RlpA-like [Candidatus Nitrospira nitrificans]
MCVRPLTKSTLPIIVIGLSAALYQGCTVTLRSVDRFIGYPVGFVERGTASWYGPGFHGNRTANGERYDMYKLTAAHRTLPLGSVAIVHSLISGRHITVRINDRGPFAKGRILDLSLAGAQVLGMVGNGTDQVEIRVVDYHPQPEGMGVLRVQVGAFTALQNARALLAHVQRDFADGRIIQVDLPEGRRYRVQIGRFLIESEAQIAVGRLDRTFNLHSFVVRDDG